MPPGLYDYDDPYYSASDSEDYYGGYSDDMEYYGEYYDEEMDDDMMYDELSVCQGRGRMGTCKAPRTLLSPHPHHSPW